MKTEIKVPSVGESVQEAVLVEWYKQDGEQVEKDEPLFLIETDMVTLEVNAEADGVLHITVQQGETVAVGAVVGFVETGRKPAAENEPPAAEQKPEKKERKDAAAEKKPGEREAAPEERVAPGKEDAASRREPETRSRQEERAILSPAVRRLAAEKKVDLAKLKGSGPGGRITKGDVLLFLESQAPAAAEREPAAGATESAGKKPVEKKPAEKEPAKAAEMRAPVFGRSTRKPMSPIRRKIAERLLQAKQQTAMLTTFNEIDMRRMMDLRSQRKEEFRKRFDVSLGIMSFFIKAAVSALKDFPEINAFIEGSDIVYHDYYHIGVAVGSERGLVVPVIRDADQLDFARLEKSIIDFVDRINDNRLKLDELEGGTFTISNGGVYGSLLSTPILNMPQSAILGMHKIEERPVAVDGKVAIRPMMYVALSYDHRIVDGREAVSFLKHIKEWIENPEDPLEEGSS